MAFICQNFPNTYHTIIEFDNNLHLYNHMIYIDVKIDEYETKESTNVVYSRTVCNSNCFMHKHNLYS